jgi:hypothetical protein
MTLHIAAPMLARPIPHVLALMADGRLHPEAITTTVASLDNAPSNLMTTPPATPPKTILTV